MEAGDPVGKNLDKVPPMSHEPDDGEEDDAEDAADGFRIARGRGRQLGGAGNGQGRGYMAGASDGLGLGPPRSWKA